MDLGEMSKTLLEIQMEDCELDLRWLPWARLTGSGFLLAGDGQELRFHVVKLITG